MPTILELFQNKELLFPGGSTAKGAVKKDSETFIEQETSGIRIKSLVEINNPLIYGNEATRIATRSTPAVEEMTSDVGGQGTDGGLIGGKIKQARDFVNDKLGIPTNAIPTRLIGKDEFKDLKSTDPVTLDSYGPNGTLVGKFLKDTGGGNPTTIGKQALGKGLGVAKDTIRGALFGEGAGDASNTANLNYAVESTSNDNTYSSVREADRIVTTLDQLEKNTKLGINLNTVSPIYGINRKEGDRPGRTYGMQGLGFNKYDPTSKDKTKSGIEPYAKANGSKNVMFQDYKLGTGDGINTVSPSDDFTMVDNAFMKSGEKEFKDFIPLWFKKIGAEKPVVFRATISGLTETSTPSWSANKFVGNPYSFHIYDGVERSLAFNLKLMAASPTELGIIWEKLKILTSYTYPTIGSGLTTPPIITFRLGDMYVDREVLVDSLTYTIPDESNWEIDGSIGYLPKTIDVALSMKFIESVGAEDRLYDMEISKAAVEAINEKRKEDKKAIDLETKTRGGKPSEETPPKVTAKKQSTTTVLTGAGSDLKSKASGKIKSLTDKGKNLAQSPVEISQGITDPIAGQSATADNLDGKTPIVAAKEEENTSGLTPWQAEKYTRMKAAGNYTSVKLAPVGSLPTWVKEHPNNPQNSKSDRYKGVICVYFQAEGAFEEHGYQNNTFYLAMGQIGNMQFSRNFANDLDDNPKYFFTPGEIEMMQKNSQQSSALDRAAGLSGRKLRIGAPKI